MLWRPRARRPAGFVEPCQPSPATRPPAGADWIHEIKHDGYRMMERGDGADVRLLKPVGKIVLLHAPERCRCRFLFLNRPNSFSKRSLDRSRMLRYPVRSRATEQQLAVASVGRDSERPCANSRLGVVSSRLSHVADLIYQLPKADTPQSSCHGTHSELLVAKPTEQAPLTQKTTALG
jgi:hypothetical protein